MNKYQEALDCVTGITRKMLDNPTVEFSKKYLKSIKLLEEFVDKEKPKKLKNGKNHKSDCLDVCCPTCNSEFECVIRKCGWGNDYQTLSRCSVCGQTLEQEWL